MKTDSPIASMGSGQRTGSRFVIVSKEEGNATLTVSNPSFGGPNAADFSLVAPFTTFDIADGGSNVNVAIRCTPAAEGTRSATFEVNTNDPVHPSVSYDLVCYAEAAPTAGFDSTPAAGGTLDFGSKTVGVNVARNLTVMETGNATLTYGSDSLSGLNSGDFTVGAYTGSIADGGPAEAIAITCTPSDVGLRSAVLSMTTNDPQKASVSWTLVCEGVAPPPPVLVEPGTSTTTPPVMLDGPNGVAISPDGRHAYVASFLSASLATYERDLVTGDLTWLSGHTYPDLNGAQYVAVSPDGRQAYVTAGVAGNFIAYDRDPTTGALGTPQYFRQSSEPRLQGAFGVTVAPDGRFIYVTSNIQNALIGFERLPNGDLAKLFTMAPADLNPAHNLA
ncbi:MAG: choice-of-anchor D domain-containing protein, partial [Anaerolineae bacterium]